MISSHVLRDDSSIPMIVTIREWSVGEGSKAETVKYQGFSE